MLISWLKMHPFLALILDSAALAAVAWIAPTAALTSFTNGFGSTAGAVGILIALGAMLGKILADSGGADNIVNRITDRLSGNMLPWGMALIAAIIGLPLFFEVGVVILVPVVILVARRTNSTLMRIGIPALAGLSVLHGLVPPHPGPQTAIALLKADQSQTLIFGLIVAIPTLIISGPLLAGTSLIDGDEGIAVTMIQQTIEDRTHVWRAYDKAYRLSVNYEVRVVKLESKREPRVAPQVRSRSHRHGSLEETP